MQRIASYDELLAIMALGEGREMEPEPFRMQPELSIVVPYGEYIRFLGNLPFEYDGLYLPINRITPERVLQCYYMDMAIAVFKELYYCSLWGGQPTRIVHQVDNACIPCIFAFNQELFNRMQQQLSRHKLDMQYIPVASPLWGYMSTLMRASLMNPAPELLQPEELLL